MDLIANVALVRDPIAAMEPRTVSSRLLSARDHPISNRYRREASRLAVDQLREAHWWGCRGTGVPQTVHLHFREKSSSANDDGLPG